jgi:hypothetical protein
LEKESGRKRARERLVVLKRKPLDTTRSPPLRGRKRARERQVVLKIEPLDATRSLPLSEEESKGEASCPKKRAS